MDIRLSISRSVDKYRYAEIHVTWECGRINEQWCWWYICVKLSIYCNHLQHGTFEKYTGDIWSVNWIDLHKMESSSCWRLMFLFLRRSFYMSFNMSRSPEYLGSSKVEYWEHQDYRGNVTVFISITNKSLTGCCQAFAHCYKVWNYKYIYWRLTHWSMGPLLLTRINFNCSMDISSITCEMKLLIHTQTSTVSTGNG